MPTNTAPPVVLAIGGHDPCGGAGIQADIEAIAAQGAVAATLVTALTAQNTRRVARVRAIEPEALIEQARVLLEDVEVAALKIGLLPTVALIEAVAEVAAGLPAAPLVLDPVLVAGTGDTLATEGIAGALRARLVPRAALLTPNRVEALALAPGTRYAEQAAAALIGDGAGAVLVTGGDGAEPTVVNTLHLRSEPPRRFEWPRLPGRFHGSGCTLAAAIAARLAAGEPLETAVQRAQAYTHEALAGAARIGREQLHPRRVCR